MIDIHERNIIKSAVAARDLDGIQIAIDNKHFALKSYPAKAVETDKNEIGFVITRDSVDRDGERILPSAFKKDFGYYLDNPVVLYNHRIGEPAVGQMVKHNITDTDISMRIKFAVDENPMAAMLYKLYSADPPFMRMTSAGFIPIEATNDEDMKLDGQKNMTFTRIEMIELSLVNIGANRYAMSMVPKSITDDPVLKSVYEQAVEEPIVIPVEHSIGESEVEPASKTLHVNISDDDQPILVSISTPPPKEKAMDKDDEDRATDAPEPDDPQPENTPCPACAAKAKEDDAAMEGETDDADDKSVDTLKTKEAATEDDAVKKKFYDGMNWMRPFGSIEAIKEKIHKALDNYLAMNLPDVERWDYLEYDLFGTYPDESYVLVYCWNSKSVYKIDYTEENGMIQLSNMIKGQLDFQPEAMA